ncbi:hypothetical protein BC829DRAFT_146293 [Chytridium lagenaria]|nr:hypothetical protein BC829DRAFT_146293 [Chytridium lagenaria]
MMDDDKSLASRNPSLFAAHPILPPIAAATRRASASGRGILSRRSSARSQRPTTVTAPTDQVKRVRVMEEEEGVTNDEYENRMAVDHPIVHHGHRKPPAYKKSTELEREIVDPDHVMLTGHRGPPMPVGAESGAWSDAANPGFHLGDDDILAEIMEKSRDPFEFISHLQERPLSKEFAYMNIIKPSVKQGNLTFNPYNLEIVDFSEVDKRYGYYTISNAGVTHFNAIGHGDFTPLSQWLRECRLFHSLLQIPFFARYRVWKCFTLWRRTVLHSKILLSKKLLTKNLFTVHPILRTSLLSIRHLCVDILAQRRFINIHEQRCYYLDEFVKEQKEWVEDTSKKALKEFHQSVMEIVEKAGKECLKERGFDVTLKDPEPDEENEPTKKVPDIVDKIDKSLLVDDDFIKMKRKMEVAAITAASMSSQVQKLTFTEQAARRSECRRLQRFVKLVDYILINTLHMLTVESVKELLKVVFRGCTDSDVLVQTVNDRVAAMGHPENYRGGCRRSEYGHVDK